MFTCPLRQLSLPAAPVPHTCCCLFSCCPSSLRVCIPRVRPRWSRFTPFAASSKHVPCLEPTNKPSHSRTGTRRRAHTHAHIHTVIHTLLVTQTSTQANDVITARITACWRIQLTMLITWAGDTPVCCSPVMLRYY